MEEPKFFGKKMFYMGYVFVRSGVPRGRTTNWECNRLRRKACTARATTVGNFVKSCGDHGHPPDREEAKAEEVEFRIKEEAERNPEKSISVILRDQLRDLDPGVLARLPERKNLKKMMRRQRRAEFPPNPTRITDLQDLPLRYKNSLNGETFLIYDNEEQNKRVLVFATRRNLELLAKSTTWFLDGTFKVQ